MATININIKISVLSFKENDTNIMYCPELDISGYGDNFKEASESFKIALDEFIRYTLNKKTLEKELKRMGWVIVRKGKKTIKYKSPSIIDIINKNKDLTDIIGNKEYRKTNKLIAIPAIA